MTNEIEDLARRAVACKAWEWLPGMLTTDGDRIVSTEGTIASAGLDIDGCVGPSGWDGREVPDFTDPATLGCAVKMAVGLLDAIDRDGGSTTTRRAVLGSELSAYVLGMSSELALAAALVTALETAP
jgi:hypothetical protein